LKIVGIKRRFLFIATCTALVLYSIVRLFTAMISNAIILYTLQVLVLLLFIFLMGKFLEINVLKPIIILNKVTKEIAENNLSSKIQLDSKDEFAVLGANMNNMMKNLRHILQENLDAAEKVAKAAQDMSAMVEEANLSTQEISSTIDSIAKGTEEQSHHVKQTTLAAQQMASTAQEVAAEAQKASAFSTQAADRAKNGGEIIRNVRSKIVQVKETVDDSAQVVKNLGIRSQEIGKIIDVIRGISRQTNLLALNAAIEAARAGEHGRGFSVVADEVRNLAEQTTQSTIQIAEMISEIQKETKAAVQAMEEGTHAVEEGAGLANVANEAFSEILTSVNQTVLTIQEIAAASQEQAASSEEMTSTMEGAEAISSQNATGASQVAAAAEQQRITMEHLAESAMTLVDMADHLTSLVGRFKVMHNFQRCWRVHDCNQIDCPAYQAKEEKCWLIPNTLSQSGIPSGSVMEKRSQCHQCEVFKINTAIDQD